MFLDSVAVTTDASGMASFSVRIRRDHRFLDRSDTAFFTATATDSMGATSEFSRALELSR